MVIRKYELLTKFGWGLDWNTVQDIAFRDAIILRWCIEAEAEAIRVNSNSNSSTQQKPGRGMKLTSIEGMALQNG